MTYDELMKSFSVISAKCKIDRNTCLTIDDKVYYLYSPIVLTEALEHLAQLAYKEGYRNGRKDGYTEIVKHGQWVQVETSTNLYKCSCCNTPKLLHIYAPTNSIHMPKYCEECGARMDKEEKEK